MSLDLLSLQSQFAFLAGENPIAYLDSAATSQKPKAVIDAMSHFLSLTNANVHRGVYPLAEAATRLYSEARKTVAGFIGAKSHEIIFTKNITEAINLVARSFGETLKKNDRIALSILEHHSNIVPWQQLESRSGIGLDWITLDAEGNLDLDVLIGILQKRQVKLVAISGLSNVLGTAPNIKKITALAHEYGALTLVDAAQLIAHAPLDVRDIDCDFCCFSSHKLYGPTGIGVLYGKQKLLESMPPFLGGGDMIQSVTTKGFSCAELPRKFEAGSMPTAEAVALATAIRWIKDIGFNEISRHESALMTYALQALQAIDGLTILGTKDPDNRLGCISFTVAGVHPHDLADIVGKEGVCIRAGHHCTQPLHDALGINASARISFGVYNTTHDIDRAVTGIKKAITLLRK